MSIQKSFLEIFLCDFTLFPTALRFNHLGVRCIRFNQLLIHSLYKKKHVMVNAFVMLRTAVFTHLWLTTNLRMFKFPFLVF